MNERTRTRLAKAVYWLGGNLMQIKTYQRYYEWRPDLDVETTTHRERFPAAGWHWFPCQLSTRCISWSQTLDRKHWDHWALQHVGDTCLVGGSECPSCGGHVDPPYSWNDDEEEVPA